MSARTADGPRRWVPFALWAAVTAAYVGASGGELEGGDDGEFVALFAEGGVAHPPGFPVYSLYLRTVGGLARALRGALGWGGVEHSALDASRATAVLGAFSVPFLYGACRHVGASAFAAAAATLGWALSVRTLQVCVSAEVFALHMLLASAVIFGAARTCSRVRGAENPTVERGALCSAAAFGIGLAHHPSIVFLAPLVGAALMELWRVTPKEARSNVLTRTCVVGAVGVPLYGLLPVLSGLSAAGAWRWGDTHSLAGLARHALRVDYGSVQLARTGTRDAGGHLAAFASNLLTAGSETLGGAPEGILLATLGACGGVLFVAAGVVRTFIVREGSPRWHSLSRGFVLAHLASVLLSGPLFVAAFNVPLDGPGRFVASRFYLLPSMLMVPWAAVGTDAACRWLGTSLGGGAWVRRAVRGAGSAAVALTALGTSLIQRTGGRGVVDDGLRRALDSVPPRGLLVTSSDAGVYGLLALQTEGVRRDVCVVAAPLLRMQFYVARLEATCAPRAREGLGTVVEDAMAKRRTVALLETSPESRPLLDRWPSHPWGNTIRLVGSVAELPSPETIAERSPVLRLESAVDPSAAVRAAALPGAHSWAGYVRSFDVRTWSALADGFDASGNPSRAEACRALATALRPVE